MVDNPLPGTATVLLILPSQLIFDPSGIIKERTEQTRALVSHAAVVELSVLPNRSVKRKYIDCERQSAGVAALTIVVRTNQAQQVQATKRGHLDLIFEKGSNGVPSEESCLAGTQ
jgi:hypothetical protein